MGRSRCVPREELPVPPPPQSPGLALSLNLKCQDGGDATASGRKEGRECEKGGTYHPHPGGERRNSARGKGSPAWKTKECPLVPPKRGSSHSPGPRAQGALHPRGTPLFPRANERGSWEPWVYEWAPRPPIYRLFSCAPRVKLRTCGHLQTHTLIIVLVSGLVREI